LNGSPTPILMPSSSAKPTLQLGIQSYGGPIDLHSG
jgi:hypothetical protein